MENPKDAYHLKSLRDSQAKWSQGRIDLFKKNIYKILYII